jgi:c-di-GMP-binding flagellar brake protein YcgR
VTAAATPAIDPAPLPDKGDRVMLDGLPGGPWTSVVVGVAEGVLLVDAPRLGGRLVPLPLGRRFVLAYSSREVPCEVDAEMVAGPTADGRGGYTARLLGAARRLQRRGAVRVPVHLIVQASLAGDDEDAPVGAVTENLSAGGVLLRVAKALEAGAPVTTSVFCGGDAGTLDIGGRVVRCDRLSGERPFRVAIAFLDMPRGDEDRLVRFVFERQREMPRRGAGAV